MHAKISRGGYLAYMALHGPAWPCMASQASHRICSCSRDDKRVAAGSPGYRGADAGPPTLGESIAYHIPPPDVGPPTLGEEVSALEEKEEEEGAVEEEEEAEAAIGHQAS